MRDLITHSPDVTKLLAEVEVKLPDYIVRDGQDNAVGFVITKTPTVRKGNETLAVVRCSDEEVGLLAGLTTVEVLADVPAGGDLLAAMTLANRKKYDAIYDQTLYDIVDENGNVIGQQTPPELIGGFA